MYYLIYVSQASRPMSRDELGDILKKSRDYNTRDGVTGLLIYKLTPQDNRANFMQLLEGEHSVVRGAFDRIAADERHHTKIILEEGDLEDRNFPDWSMGFQNIEADELTEFEGFADIGSETFRIKAEAGTLTGALELMKSFYHET